MAIAAGARVLIASKAPQLVAGLVDEMAATPGELQFVGAIDPDLGGSLPLWTRESDILLIDDDSLLRLWKRTGFPDWVTRFRTLILVESNRLVEVVSRRDRLFQLILLPAPHHGLGTLIQLGLQGYVALSPQVAEDLRANRHRLRTVAAMAEEERQVLACLGVAWSAKRIEQATGMSESRVKAVTQTIIRKLHLSNRTAVAVFAITNGLSGDACASPFSTE